jgi:ATP phosphoribosyltransferase
MNSGTLTIALPNKGRLSEETLRFLDKCGLRVRRENERQYLARMYGLEAIENGKRHGIDVVFQRARDIPKVVGEGRIDLGITGFDILWETGKAQNCIPVFPDDRDERERTLPSLPYGYCSLVLAVPDHWVDITSVSDLAELAIKRKKEDRMLRVATEFPNLTRDFLFRIGVSYFEIVEVTGAAESAPRTGSADLVSDLMSSGVTLFENRLKEISGGTIISSGACLIASRSLKREAPGCIKLALAKSLIDRIEAFRVADDYVLVTANVVIPYPHADEAKLGEFLTEGLQADERMLLGKEGPTVARVMSFHSNGRLEKETVFSVGIQVARRNLDQAITILRAKTGRDILVSPLDFIYDEHPKAYPRLIERLRRR